MTNIFQGNINKEFYFWVDPTNFLTFHNLGFIGHASSNPILPQNGTFENNLLFIPNPNYKADITPYHNNILKRMRVEYIMEMHRPKNYPSRVHSLFLLDTLENANSYKEFHKSHVNDRLLISGSTKGACLYSIHDSGWFDFLCMEASFDEQTCRDCANAYWAGKKIIECQLSLYGHPWSHPPTMEVLFYGNLKISEESKREIQAQAKKAYQLAPYKYPYFHNMNFHLL